MDFLKSNFLSVSPLLHDTIHLMSGKFALSSGSTVNTEQKGSGHHDSEVISVSICADLPSSKSAQRIPPYSRVHANSAKFIATAFSKKYRRW